MAMSSSTSSLTFTVRRCEHELIAPAQPTPYEFKPLLDIDDQECLRCQISAIQLYRNNVGMQGKDPVQVIREAIAKTLVFYYPFAGRLREGLGRKLIVECTGEGVIFIEANADVTVEQFGDKLHFPFPQLEDLLYDVPGSNGVLGTPLLLIQVTRLMCGGLIFALRFNHTMSDSIGLVQFMTAISEIARGAVAPSVLPVWSRELLNARDLPHLSCVHHEYDEVSETEDALVIDGDMTHQSFFFGPKEAKALRRHLPPHLRKKNSFFEIVTACVWRCRTMALSLDPSEVVRLMSVVSAQNKLNPPLLVGYYGNTFAIPVARSTVAELCHNPLGYALELVKRAKTSVTQEYMRSLANLLVIKGRPHFTIARTFFIADMTHVGLNNVDYGWGKPVYGGPAKGGVGNLDGASTSYYMPFKNNKGENGIMVPISLPQAAMEKFVANLDMFTSDSIMAQDSKNDNIIKSTL